MPSRDLLAGRQALVLDGALATELERRGADLRDPLWSARTLLEHPSLIEAVHLAYLDAGADILTSASYQATFEGFARRALTPAEAEAALLRSVELARRAWRAWEEQRAAAAADPDREPESPGPTRDPPLVAASIGSYGAFLHDGSEYTGAYRRTDRELAAFHRDRLRVLAASGADLLAFETIPSRREAEVVVDLLEREGAGPAWISFAGRDETRIADGTPFAECVAALEGSDRVAWTGINCTPPDRAAALLESAAAVATRPFVVYPNSGERYHAGSGGWRGEPAEGWIERLLDRFLASGARVIGGCCRTTPADIAHLRRLVDAR